MCKKIIYISSRINIDNPPPNIPTKTIKQAKAMVFTPEDFSSMLGWRTFCTNKKFHAFPPCVGKTHHPF